MKQKMEQYEIELTECKEREARLKKSHQHLIDSLQKINNNSADEKTASMLVL